MFPIKKKTTYNNVTRIVADRYYANNDYNEYVLTFDPYSPKNIYGANRINIYSDWLEVTMKIVRDDVSIKQQPFLMIHDNNSTIYNKVYNPKLKLKSNRVFLIKFFFKFFFI